MAPRDFSAAFGFASRSKSRASPSSAPLRPQAHPVALARRGPQAAVRVRSSPLHRSPSRPRRSWPESERNYDMATIGTFTQASNGSFTGTVKTLTLNAKATLRPIDKESDKGRLSPGSRLGRMRRGMEEDQPREPRLHLGQAGRSELPGADLRHPERDRYRRRICDDLVALSGERPPSGGALNRAARSRLTARMRAG